MTPSCLFSTAHFPMPYLDLASVIELGWVLFPMPLEGGLMSL